MILKKNHILKLKLFLNDSKEIMHIFELEEP